MSPKCLLELRWTGKQPGAVLGISDDVVEGHAGSVAAHHDAAQNLCLAFTSLTAGEK